MKSMHRFFNNCTRCKDVSKLSVNNSSGVWDKYQEWLSYQALTSRSFFFSLFDFKNFILDLHNYLEFSQFPSCLDEAISLRKEFSIA